MKFTTSKNIGIEYDYQTGKPLLVFIHGLAQNKQVWKEVITKLDDTYGVLSFDVRGHGGSDDAHSYSINEMADDLHELLQELQETEPILIGHSMGAMIAQAYASKHPVKKLMLVDSAARAPDVTSSKEFLKRITHLAKSSPKSFATIHYLNDLHPQAAIKCVQAIQAFDIREDINKKTPTYIIIGEHDALTPLRYAQELHTLLTNSTLHIIKNAGHNTPLTHSKELHDHLKKFLESST